MKLFRSSNRRVRWCLRLGLVMALFLFIVSWTRGNVHSPDEGILQIGGADIDAWEWPPDGSDGDCDVASDCWEWRWPISEPPEDYFTETFSASYCPPWPPGSPCLVNTLGNWGFRNFVPHCQAGTEPGELEAHGWQRFRVSKDGYRPSFYYEYHDGYEPFDIYDCNNDTDEEKKTNLKKFFDILPFDPEYEHELRPDIMVDPRDLNDIKYDCLLTADEHKVQAVTLRTATAWANVGKGDFEVERVGNDIQQLVTTTDDNTITYDDFPSGMIEYHASHSHYHLQEWTELRILDDSTACKAAPDERPSWCEQTTGLKVGACVVDLMDFDDIIQVGYGSILPQFTSCSTTTFGITPGYKDRYDNTLDGQGIQLGTPSGHNNILEGNYLLEAHWDPNGVWEEYGSFRQRNNTRAYIDIEIPAFTTAKGPQCDYETNCVGWENLNGTDFSENGEGWKKNRCRDHLRCDPGDGCDHLPGPWTCVDVSGETDKFCEFGS